MRIGNSDKSCWVDMFEFIDELLSESDAARVLSESSAKDWPLVRCSNSDQGCKVTSYTRILDLHRHVCLYPEIKKNIVKNQYLNILRGSSHFFTPFCESFNSEERKARKKGIRFLFKRTQDSIKVCAQSDAKDIPFTLTFYDKKGLHLSRCRIKGLTGSQMYPVDAKVFKEVGREVKFKIEVHKWPELLLPKKYPSTWYQCQRLRSFKSAINHFRNLPQNA